MFILICDQKPTWVRLIYSTEQLYLRCPLLGDGEGDGNGREGRGKGVVGPVLKCFLRAWQSARDNHALPCNFAKYSPIKKNFTHRLSNKIRLLTTPSHLQYITVHNCSTQKAQNSSDNLPSYRIIQIITNIILLWYIEWLRISVCLQLMLNFMFLQVIEAWLWTFSEISWSRKNSEWDSLQHIRMSASYSTNIGHQITWLKPNL